MKKLFSTAIILVIVFSINAAAATVSSGGCEGASLSLEESENYLVDFEPWTGKLYLICRQSLFFTKEQTSAIAI